MSMYPASIARCQHIKVNGTQCGSPALTGRRQCFFHNRWREARIEFCQSGVPAHAITSIDLPVLEDANSVQVAIMQVLRLILAKQLEPKIAGLLLYGLQTASLNLKLTRFEPLNLADVVIEPRSVADNSLGEPAWHPSQYQRRADPAEEKAERAQAAPAGGAGTKQAERDQLQQTRDEIRAVLAGEEHLLALAAKAPTRKSSP